MNNLRYKHAIATEFALIPPGFALTHLEVMSPHLPMCAREKWGSGYGVCEFPVLLFHVYEVKMFLSEVSNLSLLNNKVTGHSWGFSG